MADFSSGIKGYVHAEAVVTVLFPIDWKGNEDVCCDQCYYFRRNYKTCGLNGEVCQYPSKFVGGSCPLVPVIESEDNDEKD